MFISAQIMAINKGCSLLLKLNIIVMFRSEDLENKTIEKYGYRRERQLLEEIKAELREERSKRKKAEAKARKLKQRLKDDKIIDNQ